MFEIHRLITAGVDMWIDSGRRPNDGECPAERKAQTLSNLCPMLFWQFVTLRIRFVDDKPVAQLDWFGDEDNEPPEFAAQRVLLMLLLSEDWRLRIAKCRRCGRYFFLQRIREFYASGIFCSTAHQRAMAATRRVKAQRGECHQKKVEWAAAELLRRRREGTKWYEDIRLKQELVRVVNRRLPPNQNPIKAKWVTQNQQQIQAKADSGNPESDRRRRNATPQEK